MFLLYNCSLNLLLYYVCTTFVDMMQSMNGIVCWYNLLCLENNMTKINLMMLDNSGIDYLRMLLFVFGFLGYWKIEPNSCAFSRLRQHLVFNLVTKRSRQSSKKQNVTSKKTSFKVLLQWIIFSLHFSIEKKTAIIFVSVIDYY